MPIRQRGRIIRHPLIHTPHRYAELPYLRGAAAVQIVRMLRISPNKFGFPLALHTLAGAQVRLRLGSAQINLALRSPCTNFAHK